MNARLSKLLSILQASGRPGLSRQELIQSLHVLGAPHSLEGIIKVCRHFSELAQTYPELCNHPIENLARHLEILEEIAYLKDTPDEFRDSHQRIDSPTPLYGFTGDGPICDLLLILPQKRSEDKYFEPLVAWFAWQAIRYTSQFLSLAQYQRYLDSDTGTGRPIASTAGGRLAQAFRAIRRLGVAENAEDLKMYLQLDLSMNEASSRRLSTLLRVGQLESVPKKQATEWAQRLQMDEERYHAIVEVARDTIDSSLRILLTALWEPVFDTQRKGSRANRAQRIRRECDQISLRRYGLHDVYSEPVVVGGVAKGNSSQIFLPDKRGASDDCDDVPETPTTPAVELFIAEKGDFVRAGFTARGLATAIEYENAGLPFTRTRVSRTALDHAIGFCLPIESDTTEQLGARLLIFLSLVGGRSLSAAKSWRICSIPEAESDASTLQTVEASESALTIIPEQMLLIARAGQPDVKKKLEEGLLPYLSTHNEYIALTIPEQFRALIMACLDQNVIDGRKRESYLKAARKLLRDCPKHLAVTPKGLREAIRREILALSREDIGMVKAITDCSDLNSNNVIHYASYPTCEAEGTWHRAVARVLNDPQVEAEFMPSPWAADTHVGAFHRFKIEEIARTFHDLKSRFQAHLDADDHQRAFNALTLYTILWLNISTCSRGRLNPAPTSIVNERWALILDKSRADGSTDRIIPLTDCVLAQLRGYFDYAWSLAVTEPRLRVLFQNPADGTMRFQWFRADGELVQFQPKHLEANFADLIRLPGNFARKLVRAEFAGIMSGRYLDAALGHWVRGRNPMRLTSTLPSTRFAEEWTAAQEGLERRLGLTVIGHPDIVEGKAPWPLTSIIHPRSAPKSDDCVSAPQNFEQELKICDRDLFQILEQTCEAGHLEPALVQELATRYLTSQAIEVQSELGDLADALCVYLRQKFGVPIFRAIPTAVIRKDWMLDRVALHNLAHLERHFLPAFTADIQRLPPVETTDQGRLVEFGRLLTILVWRLDLHSKAGIDAFLKNYRRKPVLGTGAARYIEIGVPGQLQHEFAHRTVFLDVFSRGYLTLAKKQLVEIINAHWHERTQSRRNIWDRAINAYLQSLGLHPLGRGATGLIIAAANQNLMLNATPALAAYASSAWVTHDLNDQELRHLVGLAPRSGCRTDLLEGVLDPSESEARGRGTGALLNLPLSQDPIRALTATESSDYWAVLDQCKSVEPSNRIEAFIQQFAIGLLSGIDFYEKEKDETQPPRLKTAQPTRRTLEKFAERVQVVGYSLLAFCDHEQGNSRIDESVLDALFELSREQMPQANHVGAWYRFCNWLRSDDCQAEKFGFEVGNLGYLSDRNVSAKILGAQTMGRIIPWLRSTRSGIGNLETRRVARGLLHVVDAYGTRRSEAEMLREIDWQGDVVRLQAYDDRTLKTSWAERLLPVELGCAEIFQRAPSESRTHAGQFIGAGRDHTAGANYFDPVNKGIKLLNGDEGLKLHHFRHTRATAMALSMHAQAVNFDAISDEFPWLDGLLMPQPQIELLLGDESNGGQGLQAMSALLGHSHPTTTLGHYCHGMGLALHAHHQGANQIDLRRTFENRLALSTVQRWVTKAGRECAGADQRTQMGFINNALLTHIEEKLDDEVHYDTTALELPEDPVFDARGPEIVSEDLDASGIVFITFERIDRCLRGEGDDVDKAVLDVVRRGLKFIANIPSGQRGSTQMRHKFDYLENGQPIPIRLPARSPTLCADMLCEWLNDLWIRHPEMAHWLVRHYVFFSQKRFGDMRVSNQAEREMALSIPTSERIRIHVEKPFRDWTARVRCLDAKGEVIHGDNQAVRWVMQYTHALLFGGRKGC